MVTGTDEAVWIEESRRGEPEAFAALVRRHQRMIHALTYRMSGSLEDAQDLAQETFVQAYRQFDTFRGDAKFSSWLYRIAVNACLNWRKRERRRAEVYECFNRTQQPEPASAEPNDAFSIEVQQALLRLPANQRAAVVLTAYEGLTHAEAARILGCSETTVSWRVFAARRKLKGWLQHLRSHD